MSVALQVMLLVVAIVVAVAGIGVALALRMTGSRGAGTVRRKATTGGPARPRVATAAPVVPMVSPRAGATVPPSAPLSPEQAHQAKLAALQAMLALGDAKAERAAKSGKVKFADTEPADEGYASTEFVDRADPPTMQISLLNLDKAPSKRSRR